MFSRNVKLFVYPTYRNGKIYNSTNIELPTHLKPLFDYLVINDKIEDIRDFDEENLKISTDKVIEQIKRGEVGWEEVVPPAVVEMIKDKCLFGFPCVVYEPKQVAHIHQAAGNL